MASMQDQLSRLVFSTEQGQLCPNCAQKISDCQCAAIQEQERLAELDGWVLMRLETSGRKGKGVTTLSGIPLIKDELYKLTSELKKRLGVGGALKDHTIEIQGDRRAQLKNLLETKGFKVKQVGG